jgi:outer membrane lipase/esterase
LCEWNYAIGGSVDFLVPAGYPGTGNLFPNLALPGTATQINNYLAAVNGQANPNALYLISSGLNNTAAAFAVFGANATLANPYLLGEAQTFTNSVARLQAAGARYIIVADGYVPPTTPPGASKEVLF